MPKPPEVSILVPSWNSADTIAESLRSLQAQSIADWECVVVDDGSTDGTVDLVRALAGDDPRIRLLRQSRKGPAAARNLGLHAARADHVLFLDSDDLISPRKLERNLEAAKSRPFTLVYGGCTYFHDQTRANRPVVNHTKSGGPAEALAWLARQNIMPVSAALVPSSMARQINGFDPALRSFEDWDFWVRCARAGASFFFDSSADAQTQIRIRAGSLSTHARQMFDYELRVRMKHRDLPPMHHEFLRLRRFHLKAGAADFLKGNWSLAWRHAAYGLPVSVLARRWKTTGRDHRLTPPNAV